MAFSSRPRQSVVANEDLSVFSIQEPKVEQPPQNIGIGGFAIKIDSCRVLFSLLQSLYSSGSSNSKVQQHANISANAKGLRISTENVARSVFGTALVNRELFSAFSVTRNGEHDNCNVSCRVSLRLLLECLNTFGSKLLETTAVELNYSSSDAILHLILEEGGVLSECSLRTIDLTDAEIDAADAVAASRRVLREEGAKGKGGGSGGGSGGGQPESAFVDYESAFRVHPCIGKLVIQSSVLHEAFKELVDQPGAHTVYIILSSDLPHLRLHSISSFGTLTIDFDKRSDPFTVFEITNGQEAVSNKYHLALFVPSIRAMAAASETFIRVNSVGMLHMAHRFNLLGIPGVSENKSAYVTFCFMPDEDEYDAAVAEEAPTQNDMREDEGKDDEV